MPGCALVRLPLLGHTPGQSFLLKAVSEDQNAVVVVVGDEGGLGWVCVAERLSKQSFAARVSLQSGQICIDVITLLHSTFLAEICSA